MRTIASLFALTTFAFAGCATAEDPSVLEVLGLTACASGKDLRALGNTSLVIDLDRAQPIEVRAIVRNHSAEKLTLIRFAWSGVEVERVRGDGVVEAGWIGESVFELSPDPEMSAERMQLDASLQADGVFPDGSLASSAPKPAAIELCHGCADASCVE